MFCDIFKLKILVKFNFKINCCFKTECIENKMFLFQHELIQNSKDVEK